MTPFSSKIKSQTNNNNSSNISEKLLVLGKKNFSKFEQIVNINVPFCGAR